MLYVIAGFTPGDPLREAAVPAAPIREATIYFLGSLAAATSVFLITYAFYIFVTPSGLRNAEVVPLRDVEIADEIVDLPANTSDYWFWGRSGSYFRTVVLQRLSNLANRERRHISVRVVLPDPDREGTGAYYKRFKQGLGEEANDETLAANVVATVAAIVWECSCNPYLKAEIGLCATVPVLRYDLSNSGALVTRDAKKLPAILINSGNPYFEMFKDAVENELAQSKKIKWDTASTSTVQVADALADEFLAKIEGLPKHEPSVVSVARTLLESKSSRYAR